MTSFDRLISYGRFACVKFTQNKDALKVFLDRVRLNLPLSNGKKGCPQMKPGNLLRIYIEEMNK